MKKIIITSMIGLFALTMTGCENKKGAFLETVETNNTVPVAIEKLMTALPQKGLSHFNTIDHAKAAKSVGMRLEPETVVIFGNPKIGTKLMQCNPSMGLELPLRMLFTVEEDGITTITYTNPEYWTLKHNIKDKTCLAIIQQAHIALQELAEKAAAK
ncbi:DUF302 domain-containing protein [Sulfurovum sp. NBC37-1]|uniref:DUF302 domain-containing protein n=1 Tax=Sulfurovum sp. (strain NBC37-1) TaxID=387093 RepID=UPI0001587759|nr:DUF302 domain-containing protein [Sulfurovum sp. NBC37-1]BAF71606.1 conserved hypothetical protein [Sulfurovum sp. NBC37-1]